MERHSIKQGAGGRGLSRKQPQVLLAICDCDNYFVKSLHISLQSMFFSKAPCCSDGATCQFTFHAGFQPQLVPVPLIPWPRCAVRIPNALPQHLCTWISEEQEAFTVRAGNCGLETRKSDGHMARSALTPWNPIPRTRASTRPCAGQPPGDPVGGPGWMDQPACGETSLTLQGRMQA